VKKEMLEIIRFDRGIPTLVDYDDFEPEELEYAKV
jgi:hypothetical protein